MEIKYAWATDIANIIDHSDIEMLKISLNIKNIDDKLWNKRGIIDCNSLLKNNIKWQKKKIKFSQILL
jgi:hypothetical protein